MAVRESISEYSPRSPTATINRVKESTQSCFNDEDIFIVTTREYEMFLAE